MTDNLFIEFSSLTNSKSRHTCYHMLLKTSVLFEKTSESKFLYLNSIIIIIIIIIYLWIYVTLCRWSAKSTIPLSVLARNQTTAWARDLDATGSW